MGLNFSALVPQTPDAYTCPSYFAS